MKTILKFLRRIFGVLILMACLTIGYAFFVEPNMLVVKKEQLNGKSGEQNTKFSVLQISDLHVSDYYKGENLQTLVKKVNELNPDIIVFTGDLYDNYAKSNNDNVVIKYLSELQATYGKFAVWGNRDYGGGAVRTYESIMNQSGFQLLNNRGETIVLEGEKKVSIGGVDDLLLGAPDINATLASMQKQDYNIFLMHEPDGAEQLSTSNIDLILSGHSHGGQIRIPFVESPKTSLAKKYISGFYEINEETKQKLYVNTGIGTARIPARFRVPPEVVLFEIVI